MKLHASGEDYLETILVPTGHEVGTVTTVSGEILTSFFMSFYTSKK